MNLQTLLNSALALRDQFPAIPPGWHYLDSAATAQKPQAVIDAITRAYGHDYATVHRGVYERSAAMTASFEAARASTASLIGGAEDEVVFARGATEAINLVAQSYRNGDRKRVLPVEGPDRALVVGRQDVHRGRGGAEARGLRGVGGSTR